MPPSPHNDDVEPLAPYDPVDSNVTEQQQQQQQQQRQQESGTTYFQTLLLLVKGYVGPGCLSLPWAFSQVGITLGCVVVLFFMAWTSYNCWIVLQIKRQHPSEVNTYPDAGTWAYGPRFGAFVSICICVLQLAICTVYFSFIGENLLAVAAGPMSHNGHALVMTLALPAILALSCLASITKMAPFSAAGTLLLAITFALLGTVMVGEFEDRPSQPLTSIQSLSNLPLAFCAILYSYEGICLILPVEAAMRNRKSFGSVFGVSMTVVAITFCAVASFSVWVFGDVTNGSITAYLLEEKEDHRNLLVFANTAASISVLLTYPLQLFPSLELLGPILLSRKEKKRKQRRAAGTNTEEENKEDAEEQNTILQQTDEQERQPNDNDDDYAVQAQEEDDDGLFLDHHTNNDDNGGIPGDSPLLRLVLVLFTYTLALLVPNVQVLISLAGALAGSSTALLIPPLLELQYTKRHQGRRRVWSYASFLLGFVFMCIGTISSIADIVEIYSGN
mmetsp:Transcript_8727/g.12636  ORF Transcript_8727/g.12636 Transcript_8727/m.12636 type:complete len:503 (+) Transcript_8727:112-1620(+)